MLITPMDCGGFEKCSAPLCPLDRSVSQKATWYADEQICKTRRPPSWVRTQRKIAKVCAGLGPKAGCWTVQDLTTIRRVCHGIHGKSPDSTSLAIEGLEPDITKDLTGAGVPNPTARKEASCFDKAQQPLFTVMNEKQQIPAMSGVGG